MAEMVKWNLEADFLQACNCDYGCPCEFEAPPTMGYCQGVGAWRIVKGHCGDVPLDGLALAFALHTPGALHKGNGTGVCFYDENANVAQREMLQKLSMGQLGGLPFEIFPVIISKFLPPQFVKFDFKIDGRRSSVQIGDAMRIALEPIKNPVTGSEESIRVEHATGFMFKSAEVLSARECVNRVEGLKFDWPNKSGFLSHVHYSN